ncbi:PDF receptor-like isoform X2 [Acanthaster planci]|uniref:PDF receptor-like isoform X2 n=1 Tax=Acanthaster planci TaxID=133434 RepID=A0A8B7XIV2_ACAPL|nr:PDF receptor-like isoform X2 [Acanthaster planci]
MATTQEECDKFAATYQASAEELECPVFYDGTMCWVASRVNTTAYMRCPKIFPQIDTSKFVKMYCNADGTWDQVNYDLCLSEKGITKTNASLEQIQFHTDVIHGAKIMEIVGLFLSFCSLVLALLVFSCFRSLQCHRTKIHKHLFAAYIARLTFEIILMVNGFYERTQAAVGYAETFISRTPPLCVTLEVFREYTRLCTFAWMFIEGMYLNSLLSSAVFGKPKFIAFYIIGWVLSAPLIIAWAIAMHFTLGSNSNCWFANINTVYYWVFIEIPRNVLLSMNLLFLINILRVLVTKLRESNTSETKQVRKAIKATFVLLPLLGVANLVWLIPEPETEDSPGWIVVYNYGLLFLDAYQGFFVAILYCFMNAEVRSVLRRKYSTWRTYHNPNRGHNMVVTTATDVCTTEHAQFS